MIKEGATAPAFKTKDANGETVSLKDLRGQKVVLYFYPKDDTPGCTKEACSFRDAQEVRDEVQTPIHSFSRYGSRNRRGLWSMGREEVHGTNLYGRSSNHLSDR
jgi:peroxiredoxin